MKTTYIDSLNKLLNEPITDGTAFKVWKSKVINILTRIYGEKCNQIDQINKVEYRTYRRISTIGRKSNGYSSAGGGNNLETCKTEGFALIKGFIEEIETYGLPEKNDKKQENNGLNIVVNQTNSQQMTVSLNIFLSALQDELNGKQFKEIKGIIDSSEDAEPKKKKIIEKFKSFGIDVMTNIIANILTNPQIYS